MFEFERFRVKIKFCGYCLENQCHLPSAFNYEPILILLHTNILYDNFLDTSEFEQSRTKKKVTVAILRKKNTLYHSCAFIFGPILI